QVGQRRERLVQLVLGRLVLVAERAPALGHRCQLGALLRSRRTAAGGLVLLCLQLLELLRQRPPALVELHYPVEAFLRIPPRQRLPDGLRLATDQLEVEYRASLEAGRWGPARAL